MWNEKKEPVPGAEAPAESISAPSEPMQNSLNAPPVIISGQAKRYRVKDDVTFGTHPLKGRVPVLRLETGEMKPGGGWRMTPRGPEVVDTAVKKDFYSGEAIDVPLTEEKAMALLISGLIEEIP